jgi:hypothetical protein
MFYRDRVSSQINLFGLSQGESFHRPDLYILTQSLTSPLSGYSRLGWSGFQWVKLKVILEFDHRKWPSVSMSFPPIQFDNCLQGMYLFKKNHSLSNLSELSRIWMSIDDLVLFDRYGKSHVIIIFFRGILVAIVAIDRYTSCSFASH